MYAETPYGSNDREALPLAAVPAGLAPCYLPTSVGSLYFALTLVFDPSVRMSEQILNNYVDCENDAPTLISDAAEKLKDTTNLHGLVLVVV